VNVAVEQRTPFAGRLIEEAVELVAAADARGLTVRLIGGIAIRLLLGAHFDPAFERVHHDIDAITRRRDARELERLLEERGWEPATAFNRLNGARRLLFHDPLSDAQVDVFVEAFEMCHKLPLADRLDDAGPALSATDLVMTKLQIIELNEKDVSDAVALLSAHEITDDDSGMNAARVAELTCADWGLCRTITRNLDQVAQHLDRYDVDRDAVARRLAELQRRIEEAPKSRSWKLRDKIGERKRWYELPEEVGGD
jgi:hypothetical protein